MAHTTDKGRLITLIKIGQKTLNWDDTQYRQLLMQITGKQSSTDMSVAELESVISHMKKCGFSPVPKGKKAGKRGTRPLACDDQAKKIRSLWLTMHGQGIVTNPSEAALAKYCKRMTGCDALQWISTPQGSLLIEKLKQWQKRALTGGCT